MHKLFIHKLGPIEDCKLDCTDFMTFTGFQASGKSTIAKSIFYFRTIKEDIEQFMQEKALKDFSLGMIHDKEDLKKQFMDRLREKFLRVFGSSWGMDNDMSLEYYYTETCYVKVSLKEEKVYPVPNYIWIDLSPELSRFLLKNKNRLTADALGISEIQKQQFHMEICKLFDDNHSIVYIPAGRSMLTLLSQQLSYIYTTMKDSQKRTIDFCTQDYIERILSLKSEFSNGLEGIMAYPGKKSAVHKCKIMFAWELISHILRGSYSFSDGEERITLKNGRYVKINFASSGQQEAVWILNLLFYYLVKAEPVMFIIEEPESHLFPESQKYITKLIALINNCGHSIVLTTHSPYVLGTLNNLLYAGQMPEELRKEASKVISDALWIDNNTFRAWFVKNHIIEDCMDYEIGLIKNEKIDEISKTINHDFDLLFDLRIDE